MQQIHLIGGEKGGVGKSVLTRLLAQYHIDHALPFRAFDADRSHGAMLRFYADYSTPIVLDEFSSADQLVEAAVERPQDILVDLPAQTSQTLFRWMDENDLLGFAAAEGFGVVLWHVLDDGADGIELLARLLEHCGTNAQYVVVKNRGRGKDFSAFEASSARATAASIGVPIIELPELHGPTMSKVDHKNLSFWSAAYNKDSGLGLMERQRVKVWLRKGYEQLNMLGGGLFCRPAADQAPPQSDTGD